MHSRSDNVGIYYLLTSDGESGTYSIASMRIDIGNSSPVFSLEEQSFGDMDHRHTLILLISGISELHQDNRSTWCYLGETRLAMRLLTRMKTIVAREWACKRVEEPQRSRMDGSD